MGSPESRAGSNCARRAPNILRNILSLVDFCCRKPARNAWSNDSVRFNICGFFLGLFSKQRGSVFGVTRFSAAAVFGVTRISTAAGFGVTRFIPAAAGFFLRGE